MKALQTLPDGYAQIAHIDLMKNKKEMLYVNIGTGEVGIPMRIGATPEITVFTLKRK